MNSETIEGVANSGTTCVHSQLPEGYIRLLRLHAGSADDPLQGTLVDVPFRVPQAIFQCEADRSNEIEERGGTSGESDQDSTSESIESVSAWTRGR